MPFFAGVLVGQRGGVICVEVEENARVDILRRALIDEVNRDDGNKRILTQDDRVKQLSWGEVPDDIQDILSVGPLDPTSSIAEKTIQVLIVDSLQTASVGRKRPAENEVVVPRKAVKSEAAREITGEQRQQREPKRATKKDKGEYQVGDLASFVTKMARLQAKESDENDNELVAMMNR
ncbi:hypothetical protein PHYPSEUDO_009192 [Phytophthora pseudosyringae]|uniref:Uncharacterized protein n=1 Tax=Phytophthora pseudosyringae TaxID=221518 RepID=A0A8T1WCH0_9STRA|nr:hypothetical protein PHYPSEUDO_009192 [Phytophthora pseudosyringae]